MYIAVTIKRYRAVKEVGKIKMNVGIVAYYQVMQVCQVTVSSLFARSFSSFGMGKILEFYCVTAANLFNFNLM